VVVVIGKPPGPLVLGRLDAALRALGKPVVTCFASGGMTASMAAPAAHAAATLEDAALAAIALVRGETPRAIELGPPPADVERLVAAQARALVPGQRFVRGVYSGGTLAWEAVALLQQQLTDVAPGVSGEGSGHRVVDLGDDRFTVGRPHPMIDGAVRRDRIAREAADPTTAVLLLDVVLGYGAHPDPAGELLPALTAARATASAAGRGLAIVASVTGTERDPQVRSTQAAALRVAGVAVMDSNAQAARLAARVAARVPATAS